MHLWLICLNWQRHYDHPVFIPLNLCVVDLLPCGDEPQTGKGCRKADHNRFGVSVMYGRWLAHSVGSFLLNIPVILLGLPLVALGLKFKREFPETRQPFTQFTEQGEWMLVRLPSWLKWWDNPYDGFLGDKRGYWADQCAKSGRHFTDFKSMWLWGAVRNPANYFSRNVCCIDISRCTIEKVWGDDVVEEEPGLRQAQFLCATRDDGKKYYRMFISYALPFKADKAFMLDIGYKFKLSHNGMPKDAPEKDRLRGDVFVISPWKHLR